MATSDELIRLLALKRVAELRDAWGDSIPESELSKGVVVAGETLHLKGPQGIFKPRQLSDGPLTVVSTLASRYEDELLDGANALNYDYAPRSHEHENDGLKRLIATQTPVILLKQVKTKPRPEYMVVAPMYVDGCDDSQRRFALSTRADAVVKPASEGELVLREIRRAYGETTVRTRLHQAYFRRDVLTVYRGRCSVCELRTRPLLQGAHIVPDAVAEGAAAVQNGLALCSLHHAAYDRNILRIAPDYKVLIESEWIQSGDRFANSALVQFDGQRIRLPRDTSHYPNPKFLARRFEQG
jgi:putative restriction endonuclease